MVKFNKNNLFIFLVIFCSTFSFLKPEKKDAEEVFKRWMQIQWVVPEINIKEMNNYLHGDSITGVQKDFETNVRYLNLLGDFFDLKYHLNAKDTFSTKSFSTQDLQSIFEMTYKLLENDVSGFVGYLKQINFDLLCSKGKENELSMAFLLRKYRMILDILFNVVDEYKKEKFSLTVGNNVFQYCFSPDTFSEYAALFNSKDNYSIIRFIQTILWQNLVSSGWKNWFKPCLDNLKKKVGPNTQIVYIAGGDDIYQLLKNGFYNIKVIDPMLVFQERFYSNNWRWLLKGEEGVGGRGDELEFVFDEKNIVLKRVDYKEISVEFVKLSSGYGWQVPKSITVWNVYDGKNKLLGQVIYERRLATQNDFVKKANEVLLMSFDELAQAIDDPKNDGWGMDLSKFDPNLEIFVKQLRNPITTNVLKNIKFNLDQREKLNYIKLYSDATHDDMFRTLQVLNLQESSIKNNSKVQK